ncbi:MAG: hypothetical protein JXQ73_04135 [Phycisphaerae bacterium]|nr:hypothetical protein [Phycisphaerae bacterium]
MTDSQGPTAPPHRLAGVWVQVVALCFGMAASMHLAGMAGVYRAMLDPLPRTTVLVVAVALLAASVGLWLPQGLIASRLRLARRGSAQSSAESPLEFIRSSGDPSRQGLLWIVFAIACVAAGALALALLWTTGPVGSLHDGVVDSFFQSQAELLILDLAAVSAGMLVPWLIMGFATACLYSLATAHGPNGPTAGGLAGSLVLGVALGLAATAWGALQTSPARTVLVGSLPLFLAAIVAIVRAGKRYPVDNDTTPAPPRLPEHAPEAGYALLATLAIWGGLVGTSVAVWPRVIITSGHLPQSIGPLLPAWLMAWVALGIWLGGLLAQRSRRPVGGCGLAMVASGAAVGLAAACFALVGPGDPGTANHPDKLTALLSLLALTITGAVAGATFPYLKRSVLIQSGSMGIGWAQVLTAAFAGAVLGVLTATCFNVPSAGSLVALAGAGILTLAMGGLLVIFDVGGPSPHRALRLLFVFAVLLTMMVGLPSVSRQWLRDRDDILAVREGGWLTFTLTRDDGRSAVIVGPQVTGTSHASAKQTGMRRALEAVARLRGPISRCWLISAGDLQPAWLETSFHQTVVATLYDPAGEQLYDALLRQRDVTSTAHDSSLPALRALRSTRGQFELVVIAAIPGGHAANQAVWSVETLRRAAARLAPKGVLVGLLNPSDYSRISLATLVATFAASVGKSAKAAIVEGDGETVLALIAARPDRDASPRWHWEAAAAGAPLKAGPLLTFLEVARGIRPNSLRNLALLDLGRPESAGGLQLATYVSGTAEWSPIVPSTAPPPLRAPERP